MDFSTSAAFFGWKPAAWLRVTGEDAASFLQGQFTNELRGVASGGAVYGLWLTLKGKVLADSFVVRGAGGGVGGAGTAEVGATSGREFWVGSYFSPAAVIRERLESFVIADDVVIEDVTAEWAGIAWAGGGGEVPRGEVVFPGRRGSGPWTEWMFPLARSEEVRARWTGARELTAEEMARQRIEAGIPSVPADIGPGDLPGEGALERVAISYTKGCYLGQEVMARLKSMGQVRRRLRRVQGAGRAVPGVLPAALFLRDRKVGEVRSAVSDGAGGWWGLAMLSLLQLEPGARLAFEPNGVAEVDVQEAS